MRARVPAYGWLEAKRLGSRGMPCKSPASATRLLRLSATSNLEIASLRSERTCCTKAITSDWLRTRPGKTPLPNGAGYERLQSLRRCRTRALRHVLPARRDFHRRRRGLPDVG